MKGVQPKLGSKVLNIVCCKDGLNIAEMESTVCNFHCIMVNHHIQNHCSFVSLLRCLKNANDNFHKKKWRRKLAAADDNDDIEESAGEESSGWWVEQESNETTQ